MIRQGLTAIILSVFITFSAPAQETMPEAPIISEQEIEKRARVVGRALRCVVCQNQSIEDSNASLAEDMRTLVRARIRDGQTNEEVIDYMQSRYGDFVLLEPPVQTNTYLLWAAPFLLLLAGLAWFMRLSRRKQS